jgi:hypothetical protein
MPAVRYETTNISSKPRLVNAPVDDQYRRIRRYRALQGRSVACITLYAIIPSLYAVFSVVLGKANVIIFEDIEEA